MPWKLSVTTPSNLYADGVILRVNRSSLTEEDLTLSGAPRGRFVTIRSERPESLLRIASWFQRDMELDRITKVEITKES